MSSHAVLVTVLDEPGILFGLTKVFADHNANVTHLDLHASGPNPAVYFEFSVDDAAKPRVVAELRQARGVLRLEETPSLTKIYGKRIIVMGGGAQVGQVALGAITEADRHNIRGERISVDTIPLVGEHELAAAVRAIVRLPRVKLLVLAGSLMGGDITAAVEDVRRAGLYGDLAEHGGQRAGRRRSRRQRPGAGWRDGRHGGRGHGQVRHRPAAEEAVLKWVLKIRGVKIVRIDCRGMISD